MSANDNSEWMMKYDQQMTAVVDCSALVEPINDRRRDLGELWLDVDGFCCFRFPKSRLPHFSSKLGVFPPYNDRIRDLPERGFRVSSTSQQGCQEEKSGSSMLLMITLMD